MKTSKTMSGLRIAYGICLIVPQMAWGQTEKLGIIEYTPPLGWTKTPKENVVSFSNRNQATGSFCLINDSLNSMV